MVVLTWLWWSPAAAARAQLAEPAVSLPNEYTVKAVFLYSFGRYIEWPETMFRNASLTRLLLGLLAKIPLAEHSMTSHRRRPFRIGESSCDGSLLRTSTISRVTSCLSANRFHPTSKRLSSGTHKDTVMLVVGETPGFAENGGDVNFFIDGGRVRFEINVDTARRSRLRMDAKLLNLGEPVGSQRRQPPLRSAILW